MSKTKEKKITKITELRQYIMTLSTAEPRPWPDHQDGFLNGAWTYCGANDKMDLHAKRKIYYHYKKVVEIKEDKKNPRTR